MNEQSWINDQCNRSEWGPGPWDGEPDKVQWKDHVTGLSCLANRNPISGNWCGYVGVRPGHPLHGKSYNDVPVGDVHGGLTFAEECTTADAPCRGICHIPEPGEPEHLWWFGFDCHHGWDMAPGSAVWERAHGFEDSHKTYKALPYVKAECTKLAAEIAAIAP